MQYMICLGTFNPAAKQAAKDAEKLIAIFLFLYHDFFFIFCIENKICNKNSFR